MPPAGDMPKRPVRKVTAQARTPQAQAAQAQARLAAARRRRNRVGLAIGASALVVVLIVVLIIVKVSGGGKTKVATAPPETSAVVPASVLAGLAAIPPTQLAQAAQLVGSNVGSPTAITDTPLTNGGKPEVFYLGAEFCPYCAAERWPIVLALLQFGSFTGLTESHSSAIDTNPNTPTFSFHGATYSSPYLSFVGVETTTNQPQGNFYAPLDKPTAAQEALLEKYTQGYIPFVDFGARFIIKAPQYDGKILAGLTVEQVAAAVPDLSKPIGQAIEASAAHDVTALCQLTGGKPANVCTAIGP
jgi:hypothetical protein